MFVTVAAQQLKAAGHLVTPADGVPGLWNVDGLARDVTTNQLFDLAARHGNPWPWPVGPTLRIDNQV